MLCGWEHYHLSGIILVLNLRLMVYPLMDFVAYEWNISYISQEYGTTYH